MKGSPRKKLREVCSGPPRGARRQKREREGEARARERGVGSLTISTISVILPLSGESRVFFGGGGARVGLILVDSHTQSKMHDPNVAWRRGMGAMRGQEGGARGGSVACGERARMAGLRRG